MRKLSCLAAVSTTLVFIAACAATSEDDSDTTAADALTSLTVAQCKTPTVHTAPKAAPGGGTIAGSAHTTLAGCIVGAQGETGDAVLTRLTTLLGNTSRLGTVKNAQGAPVFQHFTPGARQGSLGGSLTQDFDVTLAMDHSPFTKLHTVQHKAAGSPYTLKIVNATALSASVAFFTVTVVEPGNLTLTLEAKPQLNGITVTGASDIVLEQEQDQAASASVLVSDLFRWVTTELAKTAPPPQQPVPPPPSPAGDAGDAASRDGAPSDGGAPPSDGAASPDGD
ncbi:MAG: hypothetical protein JWP87_5407 [Labilithrix sp.]|jgi:hypothetical protein|nr:hypothetical protein [Labilithrix sp.]